MHSNAEVPSARTCILRSLRSKLGLDVLTAGSPGQCDTSSGMQDIQDRRILWGMKTW